MNQPSVRPSSLSSRASGNPFPPGNDRLILIADDQDTVRDLLQTILRNHGYRTLTASDGTEAARILTEHREEIAAVITDIHMPNTGSTYVGDLFRGIRPDVPLLLISGLGNDEDPRARRPARTNDPFLLKPFRPAALIEAVHRLLHPTPPPAAT